MKKSKLLATLTLSFCMAIGALSGINCLAGESAAEEAAEWTPGVTIEKDEASPTGYTVTFVYQDAAAKNVQLYSHLMYFYDEADEEKVKYNPEEWHDGMVPVQHGDYIHDMENVDGENWVISLPLPSGGFPYLYIVDGEQIVDPANQPFTNSITGTVANLSMAYVPFDEEKQSYDLSAVVPRDGENGTIICDTYIDYAGNEQDIAVYLPYGYDENREEPYKTLYIQHGNTENETAWINEGALPNILDNLIAEGKTEPVVAVIVSYMDVEDRVENMIQAVVPYAEENYNVSTDVNDRALCGSSQGGSNTAQTYVKYPTSFGYFGIWSSAQSAELEVEGVEDADVPTVMLGIGEYDTDKDRIGSATIFSDKLDAAGIDHTFYVIPGSHDWIFWQKMCIIFLTDILWN